MKINPVNSRKNINGITFSLRELDVLSCIVTGRTSRKSIASALSISTTTVASHIRSIMQKLSCSSWENIRVFVEKAGAADELRQHFKQMNDIEAKVCSQSTLAHDREEYVAEDVHVPSKQFILSLLKSYFQKYLLGYSMLTILSLVLGLSFIIHYCNPKEISVQCELLLPPSNQLILRSKLQQNIMLYLNKSKSQKNEIPTVTLTGIGGAGKTTLARMTARNMPGVVWEIDAKTIDSLISSYASLAYALAQNKEDREKMSFIMMLPSGKIRNDSLLSYLKEHLKQRDGDWCLIFDNVESIKQIQEFIPQNSKTWGNGKVILTTRNQNSHLGKLLLLSNLNKDEQLELFQKVISINTHSKSDTIEFLLQIPPYPLDTVIAGNYVKRTKANFSLYLEQLRSSKFGDNAQRQLINREVGYDKTRYEIIHSCFQAILNETPNAKKLMLAISLMDSQNIPTNLLRGFCKDFSYDQLLDSLKKYSLITQEVSKGSIEMLSLHQSLHEIIRCYMQDCFEKKEFDKIILEIVCGIETYNKKVLELEQYDLGALMLPHLRSLTQKTILGSESWIISWIQYLNMNEMLNDRSQLTFIEFMSMAESIISYLSTPNVLHHNEERLGVLRCNYANILMLQGKMEVAIQHIQLAHMYFKQQRSNSINYLKSIYIFGEVLRGIGRFEEANKLIEQGLFFCSKHDYRKPLYLMLLTSKMILHLNKGEYLQIIHQLKETEKIANLNKANNDGSTYIFDYDFQLVRVYNEIGYYDKAIKKAKSLDHTSSYPGFRHIHWGRALLYKGKFSAAKKILLLAQQMCIDTDYIENANYFLYLLPSLGQIAIHEKKYMLAKDLLLRALSMAQVRYGINHMLTARIKAYLGNLYLEMGFFRDAENSFKESCYILRASNHTDLYIPLEGLAKLYHAQYVKINTRKETLDRSCQDLRNIRNKYLLEAYVLINDRFPKDSEHVKRITRKLDKYRVKLGRRN